ncbi:hypothetical protein WEU38_11965 [Cyanobacterium aponinum AL20118]|uniref:Uncharacterized protein n=1 Tax=Cyanobacterium aponinum AL20115 TaxID=3090662 RepID=A0AAF0ZES1_9CHRO|nr:hypothetical protein [Cyanobacterium aponinum]WPF87527.1 hypothetical protein SAY89_12000 [Cyanobacterium aponinum AL20115]
MQTEIINQLIELGFKETHLANVFCFYGDVDEVNDTAEYHIFVFLQEYDEKHKNKEGIRIYWNSFINEIYKGEKLLGFLHEYPSFQTEKRVSLERVIVEVKRINKILETKQFQELET